MNGILAGFDKMLENRVRLGIMSVLSVNDSLDFNTMKELMQVTDGNLASHLKALENRGYVRSSKKIIGRKSNTSYMITEKGRENFKSHIDALEQLIK